MGDLLLEVNNLYQCYEKNKLILEDINLCVNKGEIVGLVGTNGSGKSTLMRAICGIIPFQKGTIKIDKVPIQQRTIAQRRKVGYFSADNNLYNELMVIDNLRIFQRIYGVSNQQVNQVIKELNCTSLLNKRVGELSSGLRQRVAIACTTMNEFQVLLLDEFTNALDIENKSNIIQYIRLLSQKDNAILITSHNIKDIQELCSHIYVLRNGKIIKQANVEQFMQESAMRNNQWIICVDTNNLSSNSVEFIRKKYQTSITQNSLRIIVSEQKKAQALREMNELSADIISLNNKIDNLEDAILDVIKEQPGGDL